MTPRLIRFLDAVTSLISEGQGRQAGGELDGTETAKVTGSDGDTFDVTMVCRGDDE